MEITIMALGHALKAPQDEAEGFARKLAVLEGQAAEVPRLLAELDETNRRYTRVERQLEAVRTAANAASRALVEAPATQEPALERK